jgi:hypothetical protein
MKTTSEVKYGNNVRTEYNDSDRTQEQDITILLTNHEIRHNEQNDVFEILTRVLDPYQCVSMLTTPHIPQNMFNIRSTGDAVVCP